MNAPAYSSRTDIIRKGFDQHALSATAPPRVYLTSLHMTRSHRPFPPHLQAYMLSHMASELELIQCHTLPVCARLVNRTMVAEFSSQTILQKPSTVCSKGPCIAIYNYTPWHCSSPVAEERSTSGSLLGQLTFMRQSCPL